MPHSNRTLRLGPYLTAVCLLAGCWQEVPYTGSTATSKKASPNEPASMAGTLGTGGDGSAFGDELAKELSARSKQQATGSVEGVARNGELDTLPAASGPGRTADSRYDPSTPLFPLIGEQPQHGGTDSNFELRPGTGQAAELTAPLTINSTESTPSSSGQNDNVGAGKMPNTMPAVEPTSSAANLLPLTPVAPNPATTRRAAWLLGSRWSLAALARERGAAEKDVAEWVTLSRAQADVLGTTIDAMPPLAFASEAKSSSTPTVNYLIAEGQRLGRELTAKQGADHAALLELAVKSNLLLVLYEPGSQTSTALANVITQARERAGLPAAVTQPLLAAMAERRAPAEIRKAVFRLHDDVDKVLDEAAKR